MAEYIALGVVAIFVSIMLMAFVDWLWDRLKHRSNMHCLDCGEKDAPFPYEFASGKLGWLCEMHWRMRKFGGKVNK